MVHNIEKYFLFTAFLGLMMLVTIIFTVAGSIVSPIH
jgi:hypothetical protein